MKTSRCLLIAAAAVFATSMALAAEADKKDSAKTQPTTETHKSILAKTGTYQIMASKLKLSDEQQTKIKALLDDHKAKWDDSEKGKAYDAADAVVKEQKANKKEGKPVDQAKLDAAKKTLDELDPQFDAADAALKEAIAKVLTPAQLEKWHGLQLWMSSVSRRFHGVEFTPEQKAQIDELAAATGKDLAKATDEAAHKAVADKLQADVTKLLTPEQQAALKAAATQPHRHSKTQPAK